MILYKTNFKNEHFFAKELDKEPMFVYTVNVKSKYMFAMEVYMNRIVKRKRKLNLFKIFITIVITWIIIILLYSLFNNTYSYKNITYKTIKVSQGETLWDIARIEKYNNEYYKNMEIREIVNQIKCINSLTTANLSVNQELKIIE